MRTTHIRDIEWLVAWDGAQHSYLKNADLVFSGDMLTFVGKGYSGPADLVLSGAGTMVMPGFVDVHSHPSLEPSFRGIREEHGVPGMYMTGLYERSGAFETSDLNLKKAATTVTLCELLKSGVTSICDISVPFEGWLDLYERSGIRAFIAPGFASARWVADNDFRLDFAWDEARGQHLFAQALELVDSLPSHPSNRLSGVISPLQIETCTPDLLKESYAAAVERGIPFTVHIAQSVPEVNEIIRRHGVTPIQYAAGLGILGPNTVLGHALFIDEHSWIRWSTSTDLSLLAASGCTVAHCPTPFARYGHTMESFGSYVRAGVKMALGTDTIPHNMLEEIRLAGTLSRIAARHVHDVSTSMLFTAATVGGAGAMLRSDIGRLHSGCKADFVVIDLATPDMQPTRDPLRSLIFYAADRAVKDVWVAGCQLVKAGEILTLDHAGAAAALSIAQEEMLRGTGQRDRRGRSAEQIMPLSLPKFALPVLNGQAQREARP